MIIYEFYISVKKVRLIKKGKNELVPIPDFTGYYASKFGKLYSTLAKGCRDRFDLSKRVPPRELAVRLTKKGYCRVYMRRDSTGKREDVYIHHIIASLFVPNPNHYLEVNHKDNNPLNNAFSNLEWCTHKYNLEYGFKFGNKARNKKGQFTHK